MSIQNLIQIKNELESFGWEIDLRVTEINKIKVFSLEGSHYHEIYIDPRESDKVGHREIEHTMRICDKLGMSISIIHRPELEMIDYYYNILNHIMRENNINGKIIREGNMFILSSGNRTVSISREEIAYHVSSIVHGKGGKPSVNRCFEYLLEGVV